MRLQKASPLRRQHDRFEKSDQDSALVPARGSVRDSLLSEDSDHLIRAALLVFAAPCLGPRQAPTMGQDQCSCPELPADTGDELFGPGDTAQLVFRRAAAQGALQDALVARGAELKFSADTVLSQLVGQCFTQYAPQQHPLLYTS